MIISLYYLLGVFVEIYILFIYNRYLCTDSKPVTLVQAILISVFSWFIVIITLFVLLIDALIDNENVQSLSEKFEGK